KPKPVKSPCHKKSQLLRFVPYLVQRSRIKLAVRARRVIVRIAEAGGSMLSQLFEHQVANLRRVVQAAEHGAMRRCALRFFVTATAAASGVHFDIGKSEKALQWTLGDPHVLRIGKCQ